ncbi:MULTISPECIES: thioredoxin [Azorhizobium]|uniref:Thioredoxin n=1 Tax=Azorhizobium caulinodans (strain ATCC 43989 / DSM 5975 / JCM 20966 / LMG 6465 / NBRC 14845 / NCIMB 13405 / ORS 571) TaxID=438753 RepID=A8HT54_AZOC5|nr:MULTISPECIES: thioredoxin [Azorhizobium]TDT89433.1 thioredoxin [Azorhizobium sp. AG788]BAF90255.1 thioredoxin precursor [Azorhizobium caulinodans ORS 571]
MLFNQAGGAQTAAQGAGDGLVIDTTTQTFMADVIEESRTRPVLVDFWAPWCGPCKTLGPVIEKAVRSKKGKVLLAKMNIDDHPAIAQRLGIQSIPAVYAFVNGQPVDGFMGALPEGQVNDFIERLTGADAGIAEILEAAEQALAEGDAVGAGNAFAQILAEEPDNLKALSGLARAHVLLGDLEQAEATLAGVPANKANDPAVASARAAIELARQTADLGETAELEAAVAADPANHQARFDLALALAAGGKREDALVHLLEIVKRDRSWNEDGARKQLVQLFDAWGPTDPLTVTGRRKLSAILFA